MTGSDDKGTEEPFTLPVMPEPPHFDLSPSPRLAPGARLRLNIPLNHPFMEWVKQNTRSRVFNPRIAHDPLTIALGGVIQDYDLVEFCSIEHEVGEVTVEFRMHGDPREA
jgi:hypothetical protein